MIEDAAQYMVHCMIPINWIFFRSCYLGFYPGKNLGALGDAGAITTNSPELDSRMTPP